MDSIVIQKMPRIVLCELCKKAKDKRCISPGGDVGFAVLAGRCSGFKSRLDIETLEKINTLLEIEHYLADMKVIELTARGFKIREDVNEKQG